MAKARGFTEQKNHNLPYEMRTDKLHTKCCKGTLKALGRLNKLHQSFTRVATALGASIARTLLACVFVGGLHESTGKLKCVPL